MLTRCEVAGSETIEYCPAMKEARMTFDQLCQMLLLLLMLTIETSEFSQVPYGIDCKRRAALSDLMEETSRFGVISLTAVEPGEQIIVIIATTERCRIASRKILENRDGLSDVVAIESRTERAVLGREPGLGIRTDGVALMPDCGQGNQENKGEDGIDR
jgi:hypothetical protein